MDKTTEINYLKFKLENHLRSGEKSTQQIISAINCSIFDYIEESKIRKALKELTESKNIKRRKVSRSYYYSIKKKRELKVDSFEVDENTFGVEIELGSKLEGSYFVDILREAGLRVSSYGGWVRTNRRKYDAWQIVTDSSIDVPGFPGDVEIVSPILSGEEGLKELKLVLDILNRMKRLKLVKQNKTCGTHVHHGAKGLPMSRFIELAEISQPLIDQLVTKTRRISDEKIDKGNGDYHISPIKKEKYYVNGRIDWNGEKYVNISIRNFKSNGTIEFRQLHGTLNFNKISEWILMGQRLIKAAKLKKQIEDFKDVVSFFIFLGLIKIAVRYKMYEQR